MVSEALQHARIGHTGATKDPDGTAAQEGFLVKLNRSGKIDVDALDTAAILATGFRADEHQPTDVTAPAAASVLSVGPEMLGQDHSGGAGVEGIITDPPDNVVLMMDDKNDEFLDGTDNKVYGRLTVAEVALTGTLTFTNSLMAVTGVGTLFTTEVAVGDLIQLDADGVYAEVATVTDDFNIILAAGYGGAGGAGAGTRRRWELTFYSNVAGVETLYAGWAGTETIQWFTLKVYNLSNIPVVSGRRTIPSDQVAGDMPLATTSLAGKVVLAPDGDTTAGLVVQASDSRLFQMNIDGVPPAVGDDDTAGFREGDRWLDTAASIIYTLHDASTGAAVWLVSSAPLSPAYTPTNVSTTRTFDADATTLDEVADVLGTVIADLQARGDLG